MIFHLGRKRGQHLLSSNYAKHSARFASGLLPCKGCPILWNLEVKKSRPCKVNYVPQPTQVSLVKLSLN